MTAREIKREIIKKKSYLCVGLDTDINKIPVHLQREPNPVYLFNRAIVDATIDLAVAYKPNLAFYEALGAEGLEQLEMTVEYIRSRDPNVLIIADAKRGDIGNTAERYAKAFFFHYDFDAITLSPYMGRDSVEPFLQYPGKWAIILGLTSNSGARDFQMRRLESGEALFERILKESSSWGSVDNLMFVIGATRVEHLLRVRELVPDHFLLIPGVGAQGGSMEDVLRNGRNSYGGLLINNSRGIIYAGSAHDFADEARKAALTMISGMDPFLP